MNTYPLLHMIGVIEGLGYLKLSPTILLYEISGRTVPPTIFTFTCNLGQFFMPRFLILGLNYLAVIHLTVDTVGLLLFQAVYQAFLLYLFWVKMRSKMPISDPFFFYSNMPFILILFFPLLPSLPLFSYHFLVQVTGCSKCRLQTFYFFWARFHPPLSFFPY